MRFAAAALLLLLAACAEPGVPVGLALHPDEVTLTQRDQHLQLRAIPFDGRGDTLPPVRVTWGSSEPGIASVDRWGRLVARSSGEASIVASYTPPQGAELRATLKARVRIVERIEVEPQRIGLARRFESVDLEVRAFDEQGHAVGGLPVRFSSSDRRVALVNDEGRVSAIRGGRARVTIRVQGLQAEVPVRVARGEVRSVVVGPETLELIAPEGRRLEARCLDGKGTPVLDALPIWTSSDEGIVRVDADGQIEAVAEGVATIAAAVGDAIGTAHITVLGRE